MPTLFTHYLKFRNCIVKIIVQNTDGDFSIGTGFHIGEGYIVTAKHNLEGKTIDSIKCEYKSIGLTVDKILEHDDEQTDLIILVTDFEQAITASTTQPRPKTAPAVALAKHLSAWIRDELILTKVLVMGYPPIPLANSAFLLTTEAEINAIIKLTQLLTTEAEVNAIIKLTQSKHTHFILSSMARGGFSGAPVIDENGEVISVITKSLISNHQHEITGFCAAIAIDPIYEILAKGTTRPPYVPHDIWSTLKKQ